MSTLFGRPSLYTCVKLLALLLFSKYVTIGQHRNKCNNSIEQYTPPTSLNTTKLDNYINIVNECPEYIEY